MCCCLFTFKVCCHFDCSFQFYIFILGNFYLIGTKTFFKNIYQTKIGIANSLLKMSIIEVLGCMIALAQLISTQGRIFSTVANGKLFCCCLLLVC